jgi:hypothetical protein
VEEPLASLDGQETDIRIASATWVGDDLGRDNIAPKLYWALVAIVVAGGMLYLKFFIH